MSASEDLVQLLKLQVNVYHNAKVCGNWMLDHYDPQQTCFHIVTTGVCRLQVPGHLDDTLLNDGDLLLFPKELPHSMSPATAANGPQQHRPYADPQSEGGTGLLCAEIRFRHQAGDYLLQSLPPVLLIRNDENTPWLQYISSMIIEVSQRDSPMSRAIVNQLAELLFIHVLDHLLEQQTLQPGLLALHSDSRISKALNAIHRDPTRHWALTELAGEATMSRTLFANSFKILSGWTPMQYLSWWRMQLAWKHLSHGKGVSETADLVGYQSTAAFSRAFQACFGKRASQVKGRSRVLTETGL